MCDLAKSVGWLGGTDGKRREVGRQSPGHWLLVPGVGQVAVAVVLPTQLSRLLLTAFLAALTGRASLADHVRPGELCLQGLVIRPHQEQGHVEVVMKLARLILGGLVNLILVQSD